MILECLASLTFQQCGCLIPVTLCDDDNIETGNTVFISVSVHFVSTVNSVSRCIQYRSWTFCPTVTELSRINMNQSNRKFHRRFRKALGININWISLQENFSPSARRLQGIQMFWFDIIRKNLGLKDRKNFENQR